MFVLLAAMTLGPGIVLGWAATRARRTAQLELGNWGTHVFVLTAMLLSAVLGVAGVHSMIRFVRAVTGH